MNLRRGWGDMIRDGGMIGRLKHLKEEGETVREIRHILGHLVEERGRME